MININELLYISKSLKLDAIHNDLSLIKSRLDEPNKDIIIPLVGEFSAGKTSLINALTDGKKLETASKATTATIFEVRFGCEHSYAEVINENDEMIDVADIKILKNESLTNAKLVRVFDTSSKVPNSTVLVDTPGLSSNNPQHKLTMTSYLPFADAILLVTDVNQQITRSLLDFVETTRLTKKLIYLILTKCDTKTKNEVEIVKQYIVEKIKLPIESIICTSANKDGLDELYMLFEDIQKNKNTIVTKVLENRIQNIALNLAQYVEELLQNSFSCSDLDYKIKEQQYKLQKINNNIEKLIRDASDEIAEKGEETVNIFNSNAFTRLDSIVQSKGSDCDEAVYSAVNILATTLLGRYKNDIQLILINMARERQSKVEAVPLQSLESLDLSSIAFNDFTYDIQLSSIGHEYDKIIGGITKVGLAAAAAVALCMTGGASGIGGAAVGKISSGTLRTGQLVDALDTATDVASIASNMKTRKIIQETIKYGTKTSQNLESVELYNQQIGKYTPKKTGIIETSIGWVTDKLLGKPQRRRAINNYITETLAPEFSIQMEYIRSRLTHTIEQLLHDEIKVSTFQMEQALKDMKTGKENEQETYNLRINQLKEFKNALKLEI